MGNKWTKEQEQAIDLHERSILVSAAAGSGKTTVLIERIMRMLFSADHPVSIDRILVVTFTRAAATQMRDRLRASLLDYLEKEPENERLKEQMVLLSCADITTIDSFCKKVVSEHYEQIPGLDPGFRLADENEIRMMEDEILQTLLQEEYDKASEGFMELVFRYNSVKIFNENSNLSNMIRKLSQAADNTPWPDEWLQELSVSRPPFQALCKSILPLYFRDVISSMVELTEDYESLILYGQNVGLSEEKRDFLRREQDMFRSVQEECERILSLLEGICGQEDEKFQAELIEKINQQILKMSTYKFDTFSAAGTDRTLSEWKRISKTRSKIKDFYYLSVKFNKSPANTFFDLDYLMEEYLRQEPIRKELARITMEYRRRVRKAKDRKNLYGFSDIAHFALEILTERIPGEEGEEPKVVPSSSAATYRNQYEEVMIDEYQDGNLIQELLLTAVSKESIDRPNIFMVGDVKQSIYRFRNAEPGIFIGKYNSFDTEDSDHQKIELRANFRSHPDVLAAINYVFYHLMRSEVGGVDYTPESELKAGRVVPEDDGEQPPRTELMLMDLESEDTDADQPDEDETDRDDSDQEDSDKKEDAVDQTALEVEARMIAEKILEITDPSGAYRIPGEDGQLRPVGYSDILILLRSVKDRSEIISRILMKYGIPSISESGKTFLSSYEISLLMDALRIVDNPRQDIPLADVMLSPMFGFTNEELAKIRLFKGKEHGKLTFYDRLTSYAGESNHPKEDEVLYHKISIFLDTLERYRTLSTVLSIHDLLSGIIRERSLDAFFAAMPGGAYRMKNVRFLLDQTLKFEGTSYLGLFSFIRYVEMIEEKDLRFADTTLSTGEGDAVQIMTIHKSKGLEYPVVFVADINHQFHSNTEALITDRKYGAFLADQDRKNHTKYPGYAKKIMSNLEKKEAWGEEIRLLYVAMTRAKEYLFLTGSYKKLSEHLEKKHILLMPQKKLSVNRILGFRNYLDWLLEAGIDRRKLILAVRKAYPEMTVPGMPEEEQDLSMEFTILKRSDLTISPDDQKEKETCAESKSSEGKESVTDFEEIQKLRLSPEYQTTMERIKKYYGFEYPYEAERNQRANLSVSVLKHEAIRRLREEADDDDEEEFVFETEREEAKLPVPAFLRDSTGSEENGKAGKERKAKEDQTTELAKERTEKKVYLSASGAERGSAFHHVLERLNLGRCRDEETLRAEMDRLLSEGLLTEREVALVSLKTLLEFLQSPLGIRMADAEERGQLFKEQPFFLGLTMEEFLHDISLKSGEYWEEDFLKLSEDRNYIMVQGEIDGYFLEGDRVILMDYKTDRVSAEDGEKVLTERYEAQLFYYAMALSRILEKPVDECWIYSFSLGKAIRLDRKSE